MEGKGGSREGKVGVREGGKRWEGGWVELLREKKVGVREGGVREGIREGEGWSELGGGEKWE